MTELSGSQPSPRRSNAHSLDEFLEECRGVMRVRRLSLRTEKSYLAYIGRYIRFHRRRPEEMGRDEVEAFLTHLALHKNVAASTQNVAFNALLFLYRQVLGFELQGVQALRARRPVRVPIVLSKTEVAQLFSHLAPPYSLIASLLYGAGLRLFEAQRLRVRDLDFGNGLIVIRAGKGCKDRHAIFPESLRETVAPSSPPEPRAVGMHKSEPLRRFRCPMLCTANIPVRPWNGSGNTFFPQGCLRLMPKVDVASSIICSMVAFSAP